MNFDIVYPKVDRPLLIKSRVYHDDRGYFFEIYKNNEIKSLGLAEEFVQDNFSYSKKNVLRGVHFQTQPHAQGKYVICLKGEILDVVVDVRKGSPTFGKHTRFDLSGSDVHILYVPVGFAHGFVVKSEDSFVLYKTTAHYNPNSDAGIIWNDPQLGIDWGISDPILSEKDKELPPLDKAKNNFVFDLI